MQKPNSDNLINSLTADLRPSPRLAPAGSRAAQWLFFAAILVTAEVFLAGLFGLVPKPQDGAANILSTVVVAGAVVVAALAAFHETVPGSDTRRLRIALFGVLLPTWFVAQFVTLAAEPDAPGILLDQIHGGGTCTVFILAFAVAPAALVYLMLRRGAAVQPARCGALALLSGASAGALGMQLLCPHQEAAHLVVWHILPTLALGLCGYFAGKSLFRW